MLCFAMRSSQTGSASSALAAQSGAAFTSLIKKVPFLLISFIFLNLLRLHGSCTSPTHAGPRMEQNDKENNESFEAC